MIFDQKPILKHLGIQTYNDIYQQMQTFSVQRTVDTTDEIWLLQHEPVFTLGRNGKREHILTSSNTNSLSSIPIIQIDRGGQVTYHGPGQLVVYTLIDLKRNKLGVKQWVNHLENTVIQLLARYDVVAKSDNKAPGVYVSGKKIAALGLRVSKGRCYHGLSLNIDMDLSPFDLINPCGYEGLEITQCRDVGIKTPLQDMSSELIELLID